MNIIKTPFDALCVSIKREQEGFKKIDRKRIRYLMGLYSDVRYLEIGIDCSEYEKAVYSTMLLVICQMQQSVYGMIF